ncbi:MAG: hypothetical protein ABIQ41_10855, partial [Gemmatimonadales bacterium]
IFDGVVIRVLWRKGKMHRITHTRIDTSRSRWGSAKYFLTMYDEAGGPTAEQLFDTSKPFSSSVYDFMVVDQCLVVGTRQKINKPYIVLLSERTMELNRPVDQVAPGILSAASLNNEIGGTVDESMIHSPKCLTLDEANRHLRYGYYNEFQVDDVRQMTGEAVIVYRVENGNVVDIVRVNSPAYDWRVVMRGNNSNIKNQFYCLLNVAYGDLDTPKKWAAFKEKLVILPLYDEKSLKDLYEEFGAILMIPSGETSQNDYSTRDDRIHLLWMNYVLSLPPHAQKEGLTILSEFNKDRYDLVVWLQELESTCQNIEAAEVSDRVKGIINSSRRIAKDRIANGENYSAKGAYMKLPLVIKSTIRNLIFKENGPSLYARIREMKEFKNPKVVEPVTEIPQ